MPKVLLVFPCNRVILQNWVLILVGFGVSVFNRAEHYWNIGESKGETLVWCVLHNCLNSQQFDFGKVVCKLAVGMLHFNILTRNV